MKKQIRITIEVADKEILHINSYLITEVTYKDNTRSLHRNNIGFEGFRIMGVLQFCLNEISRMLTPGQHEWKFIERMANGKNTKGKIVKNG